MTQISEAKKGIITKQMKDVCCPRNEVIGNALLSPSTEGLITAPVPILLMR